MKFIECLNLQKILFDVVVLRIRVCSRELNLRYCLQLLSAQNSDKHNSYHIIDL